MGSSGNPGKPDSRIDKADQLDDDRHSKTDSHNDTEDCSTIRKQICDRIEKIESGRSLPHPEEILTMAECYKNPALCNYYCSHECPIGQEHVPEIKLKELSQITLEVLASLNAMEKEKNRLIEITVDGVISAEEIKDFEKIQEQLSQIAIAIDSLQLWVQKAVAEGKIEK